MAGTVLLLAALAMAAPIKVDLVKTEAGWQLTRGGKPYWINGVGGVNQIDKFVAMGGNSMRTWGAENLQVQLDAAHAQGVTLAVGIWLGHKGHGFDYNNREAVQKQFETAREVVRRYKNHPAVLVWGLGNEMEINNDNDTLWTAIGEIAAMVKKEDPNHPTMTVVAEIGPEKIERIKRLAPAIDILGVNSYGGLATLPTRLKAANWDKPYIVTEFGPNGPWEVAKTKWGSPIEQTSTEKAANYLANYKNSIEKHKGWCLGSYAFLWGEKQEQTPTWFGMMLKTGETTDVADAMSFAWTGKWPAQRAPSIQGLTIDRDEVAAGESIKAEIRASDPNATKLSYGWAVIPEVSNPGYAGEGERLADAVHTSASEVDAPQVSFKAPTKPGGYRVYCYVRDNTGRVATANRPFFVR